MKRFLKIIIFFQIGLLFNMSSLQAKEIVETRSDFEPKVTTLLAQMKLLKSHYDNLVKMSLKPSENHQKIKDTVFLMERAFVNARKMGGSKEVQKSFKVLETKFKTVKQNKNNSIKLRQALGSMNSACFRCHMTHRE